MRRAELEAGRLRGGTRIVRGMRRGGATCGVLIPGAILLLAGMLFSGCGVREESATVRPDSTLVYPSKLDQDVEVKITFAATSKRGGRGTHFYIRNKAKVYAIVEVTNPAARGTEQPLPFHLMWVDPEGEEIFTKILHADPGTEKATLRSSFTLDPERRMPGRYSLHVYLHRELVAEKAFHVGDLSQDVQARITFAGRTPDPETGKYRDVKNTFTMSKKGKVRAYLDLINPGARGKGKLDLTFKWIDPDGDKVFSKTERVSPGSRKAISSSMSIPPGKRKSGRYTLRVYMYDDFLIGERTFKLRKAAKG